jgi:hypothetical protein
MATAMLTRIRKAGSSLWSQQTASVKENVGGGDRSPQNDDESYSFFRVHKENVEQAFIRSPLSVEVTIAET